MDIKKIINSFSSKVIFNDQFFLTLRASYENIPDATLKKNSGIKEKIESLFENETWENAYEIEQLLVLLYDENSVNVELSRRLVEAKNNLMENVYKEYSELVNKDESVEFKRSILARLVNDLQWYYTRKYQKLELSKRITIRVCIAFAISVMGFLGLFVVKMSIEQFGIGDLLTASVAGLWGSSFSLLLNLEKKIKNANYYELKVLLSISYIVSRLMVGLGASLIFSFFIKSGILSGVVLPILSENLSQKDFALLVVWCFLAGFSETLVPNLLAKTEGSLHEK
ncbi:MAG: hypothetical protein H7A23_15505 [Leptospiraceae bacterium]|nr:hypothetical protein [Leptospiraceae bacterium]MCP5495956.1 hypothetical protein [Leptospiraceae bacterium]